MTDFMYALFSFLGLLILYFSVAAVADEDGAARREDHAEDNHDGEEDEGA